MSERGGIPRIERFIGRLIVTRYARATPPSKAARLLREQERELTMLVEAAGPGSTVRVQIGRLRGLEQSSTNYSLAMVAQHLARVNRDLALVLSELAQGRRSELRVSTAAYKPEAAAQPAISLAELDRSIEALEGVLKNEAAIRSSRVTHAHPWFGELPAGVWAAFGAFHQDLHLRQARAVMAGLRSGAASATPDGRR